MSPYFLSTSRRLPPSRGGSLSLTPSRREDSAPWKIPYHPWAKMITLSRCCWMSYRRQAQGPAPTPRWPPLPALLYAQVVKTVRRRRLVRVSHRVVCGTLAAVQQGLAACGWQSNTAFVERRNLSRRQHVAAVGRRVTPLCKGEAGVRQQLTLSHVHYHCCLPYASLRQPLLQPDPTNGPGSAKTWRPQTPAIAAGVTHHWGALSEG